MLEKTLCLRGFADYLSVSYADGSVSYEGFSALLESEERKTFSAAAVWKRLGEKTLSAENTYRTARIACWEMRGQISAVFGNTLLSGRYFTEDEEQVCLLDERAAEEMFGAREAEGALLYVGDTEYRVSGVLQGDRGMCVLPADKEVLFDGAAVRKKDIRSSSDTLTGTLDAYLGSAGERVVDGQLYYILAGLRLGMYLTAVSVVCGAVLFTLKERRIAGGILMAAGVCILIWTAAEMPFSSDYLPTYWADLDFYGGLLEEKSAQIDSLRQYQEFWHEEQMIH